MVHNWMAGEVKINCIAKINQQRPPEEQEDQNPSAHITSKCIINDFLNNTIIKFRCVLHCSHEQEEEKTICFGLRSGWWEWNLTTPPIHVDLHSGLETMVDDIGNATPVN